MSQDDAAPFGRLLRGFRAAAGLTQEELADRARLSARAVSALERGVNRTPRPSTLDALTAALDLSPNDVARLRAAGRRAPASTAEGARMSDQPPVLPTASAPSAPSGAPLPPAPPANSEAAVLHDMVQVLAAIRGGDFTRWVHVPHREAGRAPAQAINRELDQLYVLFQRLVSEGTRVTRELGTDGRFGCEAEVPAAGAWQRLVDSLNEMSTQLTIQVRGCNQALTALASGGEARTIAVEARGETQQLVAAINATAERLAPPAEATQAPANAGGSGPGLRW